MSEEHGEFREAYYPKHYKFCPLCGGPLEIIDFIQAGNLVHFNGCRDCLHMTKNAKK